MIWLDVLLPHFFAMNEEISVEEDYMDTDYKFEPDKFEVKEVLLNVVIESS